MSDDDGACWVTQNPPRAGGLSAVKDLELPAWTGNSVQVSPPSHPTVPLRRPPNRSRAVASDRHRMRPCRRAPHDRRRTFGGQRRALRRSPSDRATAGAKNSPAFSAACPARPREAQLDYGDQRRIHVQSCQGSAKVIRLTLPWHEGLRHSVYIRADGYNLLAARPIESAHHGLMHRNRKIGALLNLLVRRSRALSRLPCPRLDKFSAHPMC
jgi:hypothetical protein